MHTHGPLFHPDFAVRPYWWDDVDPPEGGDAPPARADVAIVGSGYCGLSAGIALARRGLRVAILEAGRIGEGASTRNGGMVSGGLKLPAAMRRALGQERFARLMDAAVGSFRHLESLIATEKLDAAYERCGRFTGAHSPGAYRRLEAQAGVLARETGYAVRMVPRARQHEEIGGGLYHGGMVVDDSGGLHPARLHRALCELFVRAGGSLHAHACVQGIDAANGTRILRSTRGQIRADAVLIATNGYTGELVPDFQRRIIPVTSFLMATEELPEPLLRELNPKRRMLVDTKRILYYFRLSPDHRRILFGGRARFSDTDEVASARVLHRFMCSVWPQMAHTRITHAWKGAVAFTFDLLPHMAQSEGVHFAGGCQGTGVTMATYLGHLSAQKILEPGQPPSIFEDLPFPARWYYRGNPWFLPIVGNYYRLRDGMERLTGW